MCVSVRTPSIWNQHFDSLADIRWRCKKWCARISFSSHSPLCNKTCNKYVQISFATSKYKSSKWDNIEPNDKNTMHTRDDCEKRSCLPPLVLCTHSRSIWSDFRNGVSVPISVHFTATVVEYPNATAASINESKRNYRILLTIVRATLSSSS